MTIQLLIDLEPDPPGPFDVAFLGRSENCFVMDNHRCALWCWLQSIDLSQKYNVLQIDRHLDALYWPPDVWASLSTKKPIHELTIEQYLTAEVVLPTDQFLAFRDDNSLSAFVHFYSHQLNELCIASHGRHYALPRWDQTHYIRCDEFFEGEYLKCLFEPYTTRARYKWIVNIDLDYFFYPDSDTNSRRLFSFEYVADLFGRLRKQLDKGRIQVVTIALSPGNTGTWNKAREMCLEICGYLGIPLGETQLRPCVGGS